MLALQLSIGAVNDLVDAALDEGRKPGKPIPRGIAGRRAAAELAVGGLVIGLGLSAVSSPTVAAIAAVGVGLGYLYDLRLSRTAWSWLPLAIALPLMPIYAWLGAAGSVPAELWVLVPVGLVAGLGLALGNGLADFDRDASAGIRTAATRLGRPMAWRIQGLALAGVVLAALLLAPRVLDPAGGDTVPSVLGLKGGSLLLLVGAALTGPSGERRAALRERGWELEAIGLALVGLTWLWGIAVREG